MKEENPIDELFKKQLENRELKPSDAVWAKIESGIDQGSTGKRKGYYWMRAAVVTLFMGLSTWVYFTQNQTALLHVEPGKVIRQDQEPEKQGAQKTDTEKKASGEKKSQKKSEPVKREIVPLMRHSNVKDYRFVQEEPEVADEEQLASNDDFEPESVELEVASEVKKPVLKLKYVVPVTQKSFYANEEPEDETTGKPRLKEKVFAYANNQFNNLLNGEPVELPKSGARGKPQLQINLGKLFNN